MAVWMSRRQAHQELGKSVFFPLARRWMAEGNSLFFRACLEISSVGAACGTFRSYGAWGIYSLRCYKHAAPTELETVARISKQALSSDQ